MAALVIPSAVQVRLKWTLGTGQGMNVLGATFATLPPDFQTLANTLGAAVKTGFSSSGMAALCPANVSLNKVGVRDISTANKAEFEDTAAAVLGTAAVELLPVHEAVCVTLRTASAGPSFRGRVYLSGWDEASNDGQGHIEAVAMTAAAAFITAIKNAMSASGLTMAVLSAPTDARVIAPTPQITIPGKPGFATPVTVVQVRNNLWDTQRRRGSPS